MRGIVRESFRSCSTNSGTMSSVAHPMCTLPDAYASRIAIGSSMSTSSSLNVLPPGAFQTLPALKPLLAWITGAQPAHTFSAIRTVLSAIGSYADVPLTSGSLRARDVAVLLDRR